MAICKVDGCDRGQAIRGYCTRHYQQIHRTGKTFGNPGRAKTGSIKVCKIEGCDEPHYGRGYCHSHYNRWWATGDPLPKKGIKKICKVEGCGEPARGNEYCNRHRIQMRQYGKIFDRTKFDPNEIVIKDGYAEVILYDKTNEEVARAKIDIDDIDRVSKYKWHLVSGYVCRFHGYLHRFIMNNPDISVDHINRDKLDNRKSNLRAVGQHVNIANSKIRSDNTSGYRGVTWREGARKWRAEIVNRRKYIFIGEFSDIRKAISARRRAEIKYFGEYCTP